MGNLRFPMDAAGRSMFFFGCGLLAFGLWLL